MKKNTIALIMLMAGMTGMRAQAPSAPPENYPVDSASVEHAGVPRGELIKCSYNHSAIFPGTYRDYWIYVPAQYRPDHPACVYVNQDGIQWKAPTVMDNLINSGEMPVTIGVLPGNNGICYKQLPRGKLLFE
jgi:gluconolactonase